MIQLKAFGPKVIRKAYLVAPESPRRAFYTIWLENYQGAYRICKESGGFSKVWQRRTWIYESLEEAEKVFKSRLQSKLNPQRRSTRKYRLALE
jgi:hypothetical protein